MSDPKEQCPKCGSWLGFSGPSYVQNYPEGERLAYVCKRCGYSYTEPCADASTETTETGK